MLDLRGARLIARLIVCTTSRFPPGCKPELCESREVVRNRCTRPSRASSVVSLRPRASVYFTRASHLRNPRHMRPLLITLCMAIISQGRAQELGTPEFSQQGAALFQTHCTYCHGARGQGGRGTDLTTGQYKYGGSDASLYATIRNGVRGTEMPAVLATDDEVWKMVA